MKIQDIMKKTIVLSVVIALSIGVSLAQSSVWEISKDGNTLYLGGSVHLLRAEDFPLPKEFDMAFNKSEVLVLEADIGQMNNPEVLPKLIAQAMLSGDATLKTLLNAETYKLLEDKCTELSLPIAGVMKMKPGMVATTLSSMKLLQLGFTPQGVDTYYFAQANEQNRKTEFLETLDFQIDLLVNIGTGYENEFIRYALEDLDNVEKEINILIPEWRNGTSKYMDTGIEEMRNKFPPVYKAMLSDRNKAWLTKLENYLNDKKVEFVVVGEAHLYGKDGLLSLLQEKGYVVKQVK